MLSLSCWVLGFMYCATVMEDEEVKPEKEKVFWYFALGIICSAVNYVVCIDQPYVDAFEGALNGCRFYGMAGESNTHCIAVLRFLFYMGL